MSTTTAIPRTSLKFNSFYNVLNGKLVTTELTRHSVNPSTLEANPEVPLSTSKHVDEAVGYAKAAAKLWAAFPLSHRQQAVIDFANALRAIKDEFGILLTKEQGKPVIPMNHGSYTLHLILL
jgi:acyl-CoA reductase-like NAD-dependent aldehyde dehydrogenase